MKLDYCNEILPLNNLGKHLKFKFIPTFIKRIDTAVLTFNIVTNKNEQF